jgi:dTDP-4-amino-4,6-dideoxygalactose transaminase
VHGQICDMVALEALAKPRGLLVLEDASHAHGARYRGHRAGSLGVAAAFSVSTEPQSRSDGRRRRRPH